MFINNTINPISSEALSLTVVDKRRLNSAAQSYLICEIRVMVISNFVNKAFKWKVRPLEFLCFNTISPAHVYDLNMSSFNGEMFVLLYWNKDALYEH